MYPSFIKVAQEEGNKKAEFVFTRAKLAEAVHAELYMDAYNNIDAPTDEAYYLCPICGYIHKGDDFEKCPICFTPADKFRKVEVVRTHSAHLMRPSFGAVAFFVRMGASRCCRTRATDTV